MCASGARVQSTEWCAECAEFRVCTRVESAPVYSVSSAVCRLQSVVSSVAQSAECVQCGPVSQRAVYSVQSAECTESVPECTESSVQCLYSALCALCTLDSALCSGTLSAL